MREDLQQRATRHERKTENTQQRAKHGHNGQQLHGDNTQLKQSQAQRREDPGFLRSFFLWRRSSLQPKGGVLLRTRWRKTLPRESTAHKRKTPWTIMAANAPTAKITLGMPQMKIPAPGLSIGCHLAVAALLGTVDKPREHLVGIEENWRNCGGVVKKRTTAPPEVCLPAATEGGVPRSVLLFVTWPASLCSGLSPCLRVCLCHQRLQLISYSRKTLTKPRKNLRRDTSES